MSLAKLVNEKLFRFFRFLGLDRVPSKLLLSQYLTCVVDATSFLRPVKTLPVSLSASAELIPLRKNQRIRVVSLCLISSGSVSVTFLSGGSGGTSITGAMPLVSNTGLALSGECLFESVKSENIYLTLSAGVGVYGFITYYYLDDDKVGSG